MNTKNIFEQLAHDLETRTPSIQPLPSTNERKKNGQFEKGHGRKPTVFFEKGHKMTPLMEFSAKVNWLNFQLGASIGNIGRAQLAVNEHEASDLLAHTSRTELKAITMEVIALIEHMKSLQDKVAQFNKTKKHRTV